MTDLPPDLSEDDALAAEYVLGVLDLSARIAAEARLNAEPAFAERVARWEADFAPLNAAYPETPPPADLLPRIEARLFPQPVRRRLTWLRFLGGTVTAGAIGAAVLVALPRINPPTGPTATLTAEAQPLVFAASYADGTLRLEQTAGEPAEAGRVYEAWLIVGDAAPVSLGLIDGRAVELPLSDLVQGSVLAVSLEPAGGSTTGAPSGPVLVTGVIGA